MLANLLIHDLLWDGFFGFVSHILYFTLGFDDNGLGVLLENGALAVDTKTS